MNLYANLGEVKTALRIATSVTTHDAYLLGLIGGASRAVENYCRRHFHTVSEVRYFGVWNTGGVVLDDVLSVSAIGADSEDDGSFDGEAWVEGVDYVLYPRHKWPKWHLKPHKNTYKSLEANDEYLKVTGVWGFGDGTSASPWKSVGSTGTVADGSGTSLTLGTSGVVFAGDTLLIGSEQLYVEEVSGSTATVVRGVNGTTAAAHSAAAAYRGQYPDPVKRFVVALVTEAYSKRTAVGVRQEMLGSHQIIYTDTDEAVYQRAIGAYKRAAVN